MPYIRRTYDGAIPASNQPKSNKAEVLRLLKELTHFMTLEQAQKMRLIYEPPAGSNLYLRTAVVVEKSTDRERYKKLVVPTLSIPPETQGELIMEIRIWFEPKSMANEGVKPKIDKTHPTTAEHLTSQGLLTKDEIRILERDEGRGWLKDLSQGLAEARSYEMDEGIGHEDSVEESKPSGG